jgi:DNA-binding Xre family transcriptional regulator
MKINFAPFRRWFYTYHPTQKRQDFQKETGLAPSTCSKIWNDRDCKLSTVDRICETYNLDLDQVIERKKD